VKAGDEPDSLITLMSNHPKETLVKMRTLLEQMVKCSCDKLGCPPAVASSDLLDKIKWLQQQNAVKNTVVDSMHSVRIEGNNAAHGKLDIADPTKTVLATALHFIQVVEWFIGCHSSEEKTIA